MCPSRGTRHEDGVKGPLSEFSTWMTIFIFFLFWHLIPFINPLNSLVDHLWKFPTLLDMNKGERILTETSGLHCKWTCRSPELRRDGDREGNLVGRRGRSVLRLCLDNKHTIITYLWVALGLVEMLWRLEGELTPQHTTQPLSTTGSLECPEAGGRSTLAVWLYNRDTIGTGAIHEQRGWS